MTTESAKAWTPRTDEESMLHYMDGVDGTYETREIVLADFARQLERESLAYKATWEEEVRENHRRAKKIMELIAALAACQKDAERYHVLRNIAPWVSGLCVIDTTEVPDDTTMWTTEGLDKRCDAALDMAAQEKAG